jgi:hypothetical protein
MGAHDSHLIGHEGDERPAPPAALAQRRTRLVLAALGLTLTAAMAWWGWNQSAEHRALVDMPAAERRMLYQETRRSTETLCADARSDSALEQRCQESAGFLLLFPECDGECQAFARSLVRQPAR